MLDLIYAILGKSHCDWCIERPPSWFDRLMRFDQAMPTAERRWYERAVMRLPDPGIWKLGRRWHDRFHRR